jgi:hypothetical protein
LAGGKLVLADQPAHSVRIIKLVDTSVTAAAPTITAEVPSSAEAGAVVKFAATAKPDGVPAIAYRWDFGDGTTEDSAQVSHTFTEEASYPVRLKVEGVDGIATEQTFPIAIHGMLRSQFDLLNNRRYVEGQAH